MNRFIVPEVSGISVANSRKCESPNLPIFTKKCMPGGNRKDTILRETSVIEQGNYGVLTQNMK